MLAKPIEVVGIDKSLHDWLLFIETPGLAGGLVEGSTGICRNCSGCLQSKLAANAQVCLESIPFLDKIWAIIFLPEMWPELNIVMSSDRITTSKEHSQGMPVITHLESTLDHISGSSRYTVSHDLRERLLLPPNHTSRLAEVE